MDLTNNRLQSFNGKLKSTLPLFSNTETSEENLFIVLKCLRLDRDKNVMKMVQKQHTKSFENPELTKYFSHSTQCI